jgi:NAD(P)-dependent dehydrogenase (short-subunit alcohol dehydrogenase family)
MKTFSLEVALVTGGASGIGKELAKQLSRSGARVIIADRDLARAQAAAAECRDARAVQLDVTDAAQFKAIVEEIVAVEGRIDALFNNAGIGLAGAAQDLSIEDWRKIIEVDLMGVIHGIAAVYPRLVAQKSGRIVNTASGAGLAPRPGMTAYAAAKHGVIGLTVSLRAEAALHGVRVSAFCPGYVATEIQSSSRYVNLDKKKLEEKIPIKPMSAERCAELALEGVLKNRAIIAISAYVKLDWWLYRLSPALAVRVARWRARIMKESAESAIAT